jgi:hypothetical protein
MIAAALAALWTGCGSDEAADPKTSAAEPENVAPPAAPAEEPAPPEEPPAEAGPPKRIFAKRFVVNIRSEPREDAERLGYLRAGAVIQAKTASPAHRDEACPRGWYELSTEGFVCNGRDVIAFDGDRLPEARATQPDFEAPLPYVYGATRVRTPLYRRLPSDEEAVLYEGYVIPGTEPPPATANEGARAPASDGGNVVAAAPSAAPAAADAPATGNSITPAAAPTPSATAEAPGPTTLTAAAPSTDPATPPEPVTLDGLLGERGSVVFRQLMPGFILSLDRPFRTGQRQYWRTQNNGFVPLRRVVRRDGSDFQGTVLEEGGPTLPIAFVVTRRVNGYERNESGHLRPSRPAALEYHDRVFVEGQEEDGRTTYLRTPEGRYYRERDLVVVPAIERPAEIPAGASWIDVNLTDQTLVAYDGSDRPVFVTLVSTGRIRRPGVEELDHRTPPGVYQIRAKHVTTTMDGDSAVDGPYSIEDVPYVMYFHGAYALHSAFWHNRFGHTKSHGCVNMAPLDARWLFRWSGPHLGDKWHGAFPTANNPATWVVVRGETQVG